MFWTFSVDFHGLDFWDDVTAQGRHWGFFAEFTRFIIFTGFYFWLLTNAVSGHNIAGTIIASMQQLNGTAAGLPSGASHSSVMDTGVLIWTQAANNLTLQPIDSLIAVM